MLRQLKEQMLRSQASNEDVNAFELRSEGKRLPDNTFIWQDGSMDFKFLGAERGRLRAARDAARVAACKAIGANPSKIALKDALAIQSDLIAGFERPIFQRRFDELSEMFKDNERKFNVERQKHFLTVQKIV